MATRSDPVTRPRSPRGAGETLRADLLDAAAELMATHGTLDGVSLRAVARAAGVSPTAVYRHFDDHVTLLRESVAQCWRNFHAAMRDAADSSDDPFVAFANAGEAYVRFAMERPGQYRVLFANSIDLGPDAAGPAGVAAFQVLVDLVTGMLRALDDDRDPQFVAFQVHSWIHGIVDLVGRHPDTAWPPMDALLVGLRDALGLTPPAN